MGKWDFLTTKHGYHADEVISAVQKGIRRGNEEDAVFFAYEIMCTGPEFAEKFWQRLLVISVEDVGLANPQLLPVIRTLYENYKMLEAEGREDMYLQGLLATVLLCRSNKSRYIDELYNNLKAKIESEDYRREIHDYVLDKHTGKGETMSRGYDHFWSEASLIKNDVSENDKEHLHEILQRLKKTDRE